MINLGIEENTLLVNLQLNSPILTTVLQVNDTLGVQISSKQNNRLEMETDGLYVLDELIPDPLAYYILSKG